ncbi:ferrous iron transport protein B [Lachnospiraceae bacterium MD1]|jgi:ferrous iron transport protein B|uniref:Ferrous iron transport protein B n=1 Tax=Variimorphobacter saccharofermentans TaxID=2755051 RepID=A0A839JW93_9FIRM|nr:ferrous iron transport protein B [Variimorphobacter saccharofermentans]MBB2181943.1 ferrous iron transport protein B [Variimorphobacter saccharofermentans]
MREELQVGFVGNPNCGKTTLFNAYTGANLKVANWPGVTVEKKEGAFKYHDHKFKLVDLPGIYSLTSYTMEERLTREYILDSNVDVIVNVVDASSLERNLYLTLQLIELGKPIILALNMMDIVEERGMEIDLHRLPEMLGVPVIPVSARKKTGLDILMHTVSHHKDKGFDHNLEHHHANLSIKEIRHKHQHHNEYPVVYSDEIEDKIDEVSELLHSKYGNVNNLRWHAIKILELDQGILEKYPLKLTGVVDHSYESEIINQKYDFIEEIIEEVLVNKSKKSEATDRIDGILTHRYLGLPIFLGIMALIFLLTFQIGDFLKGGFEVALDAFSVTTLNFLVKINASDFVTSLIVDGIIAGVGGILTFLPNIFILFLALAYLEDSGYMARVAYVMDGIMGKLGLSGRAFIPMLLGFGCTVPAIMASRSLENMQDRRKTILVTPFMSCSARLPIYVLFSEMFFEDMAVVAAFSMYLIGIVVAIIVAYVMKDRKELNAGNTLLIELPEYKSPNVRTILIYAWEKVKEYLTKAGTTIFAASVVIWFVLNFGPSGMVSDMSQSFGAIIGKAIAPVLAPAGLGLWQIVVALISGVAAKEVVVSSFSVLFEINNITSPDGMTSLMGILGQYGFGALNAYSLMVFSLLYIPCVATIGVIQREMRSIKWTVFTVVFQLGVALLMSTLIYQIGSLFL